MGAWGHQPRDNDDSGDLYGEITAAAARALDKVYRRKQPFSWDRWARLGALQRVLDEMPGAAIWMDADVFKVAARVDIPAMREDEEWLSEWADPAAVKRALSSMERKIEAILAKM